MSAHAFGPELEARIAEREWVYPSAITALKALRDDPHRLREFVVPQFRQGPLWRQIVEDRLFETARATVDELLAKAAELEGTDA